jgi:plasmid stability protein
MSEKGARARFFGEAIAPYGSVAGAGVAHTKLSISLPNDLVEVVRSTAAETGESVSATIAAALRRTLQDAEQARLDAALALDAEDDRGWAAATAEIHAGLLEELEW